MKSAASLQLHVQTSGFCEAMNFSHNAICCKQAPCWSACETMKSAFLCKAITYSTYEKNYATICYQLTREPNCTRIMCICIPDNTSGALLNKYAISPFGALCWGDCSLLSKDKIASKRIMVSTPTIFAHSLKLEQGAESCKSLIKSEFNFQLHCTLQI